ncbi:MAG: glycosyltransferase, partial [Pseudomonadota bacterium]
MNRCFEFSLDQPGLHGVRFLVSRTALPTDGGVEAGFLSGVTDLKRHPAEVAIAEAFSGAVADPGTTHLVIARNPKLVLDPDLAQRVAHTLRCLPAEPVWSIAAPAGLGLAGRHHLALYATAAPAIPEVSGPQPLLDPAPDLTIVNAAFARALTDGWASPPDAALELILALEGYVAGRIALFTPTLTAGINGKLMARDPIAASAELSRHLADRFPGQSVATLSGETTIGANASPKSAGLPRKPAALLDVLIGLTLKRHADDISISIVVRTRFDRLHLLRRLLTSLSRTRMDGVDLEVVLSSDCAPRVCAGHIEDLRADFRALSIVAQHNAAQTHSRVDNLIGGIRAARGDYVMVIDDDDYVDLFAFEAIGKTLFMGHRPLIVTGSEVHEERWEETPSGRWVLAQSLKTSRYESSGWREMFGGINRLPICALLMPREKLQARIESFAFRHDLSEDYALFLLALTDPALPAIIEVPETVCHISVRGQENSVTMPDRTPWVRDITGYLSDLVSSPAVAGPGVWSLLTASERSAADFFEAQSRQDL